MNSPVLLVLACALVPVGGLLAATDAALMTISPARVEDLVRADRAGARRLLLVVADRPR